MPDGRGARLALEAGFLVVVAAVLVAADLRPAWIVLVMLLAWVIVAALEWAAFREQPHWSSGLPPRYYVPQQPLPPRPPSVELPAFSTYPRPAPREPEAPTWIATPQMREEVLGWPAPGLEDTETDGAAVPAAEEPQTTVEEMPEELLAEAAASAAFDDVDAGWPVAEEPVQDPWFAEELPAEPAAPEPPEPEPVAVEPPPDPEPVAAEPVVLEPEPAAHEPEPAALEPEPVAEELEPAPPPAA
ncbi:MAG TPA: hypothetical protein VLN26_16990, partial [Gaiellaceae bacterium]|nr:hypothetical protein [Gaiellaceae bacterium]